MSATAYGGGGATPLLTICVLSHNRAVQVDALLLYLRRSLLPRHTDEVELLVVNNCSTDNTAQLLERHERAGVRVVHRTQFLPTAEENMMASLEYPSGEYTWFLGDDDYPNLDAFGELLRHLRDGGADLLLSDTASIDERGVLLHDRIVGLECASLDLTLDALVAATGMLALLAGISRLVLRTAGARSVDGRRYLAIQTVYAHVPWLLAAFREARVRVLGMPLLKYTTLAPASDLLRFRRLQQSNSVGRYHYWSFGLARLMSCALDDGVLDSDVLYRAFDLNNDGSHARLLDSLMIYGFKQIMEHYRHGGVEAVSDADYANWRDLLLSLDATYLPLVRRVDALRARAVAETRIAAWRRRVRARLLQRAFSEQWSAVQREDRVRSVLFRGSVHGYDVYRGPLGWVAIRRDRLRQWPSATVLRLDVAVLCGDALCAHAERAPLLLELERAEMPGAPPLLRKFLGHAVADGASSDIGLRIEAGLHAVNRTLAEALFLLRLPYLLGVRLPRRVWRVGRHAVRVVLGR